MGRQMAMVFDLNKCIGCQTCSVACKVLWTNDEGKRDMWWCSVNTQPGRGTPRDYEQMGGGYDADGKLRPRSSSPVRRTSAAPPSSTGTTSTPPATAPAHVHLQPKTGAPTWAMNWDEDEGAGEYPERVLLLHAAHLQLLLEAELRRGLPQRRDVQARRLRRGAARRRQVPGRAAVRPRLPVQEDLLRRGEQHQPALHRLLPAPRARRRAGLRAAVPGTRGVRRLPRRSGGRDPHARRALQGGAAAASRVEHASPTSSTCRRCPPSACAPTAPSTSRNAASRSSYLESLFGAGAGAALHTLEAEMAKRKRGQPSELMDTLIAHNWKSLLGPFDRDPATITW